MEPRINTEPYAVDIDGFRMRNTLGLSLVVLIIFFAPIFLVLSKDHKGSITIIAPTDSQVLIDEIELNQDLRNGPYKQSDLKFVSVQLSLGVHKVKVISPNQQVFEDEIEIKNYKHSKIYSFENKKFKKSDGTMCP